MNTNLVIRDNDDALAAFRKAKLALFHYNQHARVTLHIARPEMIKAERELKKALNKCQLDIVL